MVIVSIVRGAPPCSPLDPRVRPLWRAGAALHAGVAWKRQKIGGGEGLGFGVEGLGSIRVEGLGFRGLGFGVLGVGARPRGGDLRAFRVQEL